MNTWPASGQTLFARNTEMDNPPVAQSGALNGISFPYIVPAGFNCTIKAYGVEGYDMAGHIVLFMFTGTTYTSAGRIAAGLPSCSGKGTSSEYTGLDFCYGPGTIINLSLANATSTEVTI